MLKTIVLALDGSEGSERGIALARELARGGGARIVIGHVEERIVAKGDMPTLRADEDEVRARIEQHAEEMKADEIDAIVEIESVVLGGPAHAINELADRVDADVVVIGTRGHSSVAGLLLGSVAHRLLHISHRPVLAVPPTD